ncbi:MAG: ferredoxin-type protein NapG, partial [Chromatiaceae bacterium]|nr:ferredoxin-type protein NapG [Chromatiaceae bacterium]
CIRCGLCVRDCPFEMLHLARLEQPIPTGTPYFIAREAGCEMCEDIPCVVACPTNALDHALTDINAADMGLAIVSDQEACIAFQGLRCEVCYNICPLRDEAITLDLEQNLRSGKHARFIPVVHSEHCTGCGKCEEACILDQAAIKVLPRHLIQGELGKHYRLGWEQQQQAGGALVTPDAEHRYNLPEGMRYDHGGEGLIEDSTPFPSNPLDTLNKP